MNRNSSPQPDESKKMMIGSIGFGILDSPFMAAVHTLQEGAVALRIIFGICLVIVLLAGIHVFRKRKELFGRDPEVTDDGWAPRNLRFWQVLLIWIFGNGSVDHDGLATPVRL